MNKTILKIFIVGMVIFIVLSIKTALASSEVINEKVEIINTADLSVEEHIKYVFGEHGDLAYAVMMSEGGGDVDAKHRNNDKRKTLDRGLFQLNDYWHSEVSDDCAYDKVCSTKEAYRISKGGTDWNEWVGYTSGNYLRYML